MTKHNRTLFKYAFCLLFALCMYSGYSQNVVDSSLYYNPVKDDIRKKIPPLEMLISEAIKNSPSIKVEELKADKVVYEIRTEKRKWAEHLGIEGTVNYGHWYYNDRDELNRADKFYLTESRRSTYSIGFYIKLPLYEIIDRRNNINKRKKEREIALVEREIKIKQLRKEVINAYEELLGQQRKLKLRMEYQEVSIMMMQNATNRYLNGQIPPEELNRQLDYKTRGDEAFNETLRLFNIAYVLLEELVGMKFNLINVVK